MIETAAPLTIPPTLVAFARELHLHDRPADPFQKLQNRVFAAVERMPADDLEELHTDSWLAAALRQLKRTGPCPCGQLFLGGGA